MKCRLTGLLFLVALAACGGGGGGAGGGSSIPAVGGPGSAPAQSAMGYVQTSGVIISPFAGGFTLNTQSAHGFVHVYILGSTQISGPAPFAGEQVTVAGTGSFSTYINADTISQFSSSPAPSGSPSASPSPIPVPPFVSTQGTVVSISATKMVVNSGYPHGFIPMTIAANAMFFGPSPAPNAYVQVSGTGSLSSSVTASAITTWTSPPSTATVSGSVNGATMYGFTMNVDSAHTAVPVVLNTSAVIAGGTLQVGSLVKVTGVGASSPSITPVQIVVNNPTPSPSPNSTPTPTPLPISQTHILTSDYLGGIYGTRSIPWSAAAPYLNWAQTTATDADAISAVGIKTEMYTDPNHTQSNDPMHTSDETTYSHDCSGNRITDQYGSITQWIMDPSSTNLQSIYANVVNSQIGSSHIDAFFQDDGAPLADANAVYTPGYPCNYTASGWISAEIALTNSAVRPVIVNGLNALLGHNVSDIMGVLASPNAFAANYEHCFSDTASAKNNGWLWLAEENSQLQVLNQGKTFECQLRNPSPADQSIDARTYAFASFMLTYDPLRSILWEEFGTASGFHVMPETQLVALNPVVPEPTDVSALMLGGGAYGREYRSCYVSGTYVGPCAFVVNPQAPGTQAPFPYPQYQHTLVLSGTGVLDGGTMSTNGPPPPTYLPALESAVVFQ